MRHHDHPLARVDEPACFAIDHSGCRSLAVVSHDRGPASHALDRYVPKGFVCEGKQSEKRISVKIHELFVINKWENLNVWMLQQQCCVPTKLSSKDLELDSSIATELNTLRSLSFPKYER